MAESSFEEKMDRLDIIIRSISGGSAKLSESVEFFEEGMKLVEEMENELANARQKVLKLVNSKDQRDSTDV